MSFLTLFHFSFFFCLFPNFPTASTEIEKVSSNYLFLFSGNPLSLPFSCLAYSLAFNPGWALESFGRFFKIQIRWPYSWIFCFIICDFIVGLGWDLLAFWCKKDAFRMATPPWNLSCEILKANNLFNKNILRILCLSSFKMY